MKRRPIEGSLLRKAKKINAEIRPAEENKRKRKRSPKGGIIRNAEAGGPASAVFRRFTSI